MVQSKITCIYKITAPFGKIYIGQTTNFYYRRNSHKQNSKYCKTNVSLSIEKYGWHKHKMEILHHLPNDISNKDLNRYECLYISFYKEAGFKLLNYQLGGKRSYMTEEIKRKISKAQIGAKNHRFGKKTTEETKEKRRNTILEKGGYRHTQETINKIQKAIHKEGRIYKGTPHTEEFKRNLSIRQTGKENKATKKRWNLYRDTKFNENPCWRTINTMHEYRQDKIFLNLKTKKDAN